MQIPDFSLPGGGSTQRSDAVRCASKFTVERLAPNVWAYTLDLINVVEKGAKSPPLPKYLTFLRDELERRRSATEDPEDDDWQGLVFSTTVPLHLDAVVTYRTMVAGQPDMFDGEEEENLPYLAEVITKVVSCKVHVAKGALTITHRAVVRCATDVRTMLGSDVLLQWDPGPVSSENPASNDPSSDDEELPAEL